jgi:hypothetical protein
MRRLLCIIALVLSGTAVWAAPPYRIIADLPADAAYADSVITVTTARLSGLLGPLAPDSLDVYIVARAARFDSLSGPSVPDWGAAVAIPYKNRIVVKSPLILTGDKSLGELVAHEFSHIALARAVRNRPVPRWLDEGLAMYASAEWGWGDNLAMGWAVISGNIIPLSGIERLNRFQSGQAQVAYSESYLAFRYFLDTYGKSGLQLLLADLADGRSIDDAFVTAIGTDQAGFEREFSTYIHGRYNLITMIFNTNIFWIFLALLIVVGFVLYLLRRKKRFAEFDEYDKYHSTDFDYGEVEEPDEDKPWD